MKPPKPLPTERPFLTLYTNTFRRPDGLAKCLASVGQQTAVDDLEQIVLPDHSGYGVAGGLFGRLPWYADAVRGQYVNLLCDDDVLASADVVAKVKAFAEDRQGPPLIVVNVQKGSTVFPGVPPEGEPICGSVDLTSYIVRADLWRAYLEKYEPVYEGDWWFAHALYRAGVPAAFCDVLWAIGAQSNGRPEVDY